MFTRQGSPGADMFVDAKITPFDLRFSEICCETDFTKHLFLFFFFLGFIPLWPSLQWKKLNVRENSENTGTDLQKWRAIYFILFFY